MGLSVRNQCDSEEYFSISTISKRNMEKAGLKMTIKDLKIKAKRSKPYEKITTGSEYSYFLTRTTKIYRYKDFKQ